jgi:hypothetical protein
MDTNMQLVLDTLYERNMIQHECFVTNQAGLDLLKSSESFMPLIERVLREVVEPALSESQTVASKFPGLDPLWHEAICQNPVVSNFPGLAYVLGAYMVLGVKANPGRTVSFLATLSAPLLAEAVKNIPVFFAPEGEGYNPGIPPGQKLKEIVQGLSRSSASKDVRTAAARVMDWMIENERLS